MTKKTAYIKMPDNSVKEVEVDKHWSLTNGIINILSTNGTTFITHLVNVVIVEGR